MAEFMLEDLRRVLVTCAGEPDGVDWCAEGAGDQSFVDWGYDSIALLESASVIEQEFGVRIEDETVATLTTPNSVVEHVRELLAVRSKEAAK